MDCLRIFTEFWEMDEASGLLTDFYRILGRRLTDCVRMLAGFGGGGLRIVYGCLPDLGEEAYGLLTDFYRIWRKRHCGLLMDFDRVWRRRLTDCLRMFTGCGEDEAYGLFTDVLPDCRGRGLRIRIFTGFWGGGLRIVYGFLPDLGEEAYGLFTDFYRIGGGGLRIVDFYRIWGRRLTDCLRIFTGFGGGGLRIVYGCLPDLGEEAYGLLTVFLPEFGGGGLRIVYGFFTGFGGGGLRIVYGFLPDLEEEPYGLFTDFDRMSRRRLTIVYGFLPDLRGGGLRIVYGFLPDLGEEACGLLTDFDRILVGRRLTDCLRIFTGCRGRRLTDCLRMFTGL